MLRIHPPPCSTLFPYTTLFRSLAGHEWIDVDPAEPHAANALALGGTVIFPASFPRTRARIESCGFSVTSIDISELQKAESGLTCSSLLFEAKNSDSR